MNEVAIRFHVEEQAGGRFLATSVDVPGLVAEGRSVAEAADIARGLARKIVESCGEHGDPLPPRAGPVRRARPRLRSAGACQPAVAGERGARRSDREPARFSLAHNPGSGYRNHRNPASRGKMPQAS